MATAKTKPRKKPVTQAKATGVKAQPIEAQLSVRSKSGGSFRRCGHAFGKAPVLIPTSDLSDEQINTLMHEPQLVCEWVGELKGDAE